MTDLAALRAAAYAAVAAHEADMKSDPEYRKVARREARKQDRAIKAALAPSKPKHRMTYQSHGFYTYRGYTVTNNPDGWLVILGRKVFARGLADAAACKPVIDRLIDG